LLWFDSERNVPSAGSPMRRNISPRCATLARTEDQQDATAAPENHSQITTSDDFQSQRITIKPLCRSQILRVQDRLKYSARLHRDSSGIAPPNENEISHGRVL